ncbi:hypothetical protein BDV93DRAFT_612072 [Ceratobasidium sp. AG-I]|nr:hypothetical protein BDV93DRAFT_612072 [Ceratobasidium sp. AG-I]
MPGQLKIVVSGTKFILTQDQYKIDSPNYFTDHVAAHTSRFRGTQIKISRNAELFKLIMDYMNGYTVLPKDSPLPHGMTRKSALKNLIAEAKFYRLDSLEQKITKQFQKLDFGPSWYVMLSRTVGSDEWDRLSHLSSEAAKALSEKHGISAHLVHISGLSVPGTKILEKFGIELPFRVDAAWEEPSGDNTIQVVVLSIVADNKG